MMADSGARGSAAQIRQLAGMRGLMAKPDGSIIETPITANFREGLNVLQYFISTHGARKGLADTALKTANSGYLTRRLVDVTQDLVVTEDDCGTSNGVAMKALVEGGEVIEALRERILGRVDGSRRRQPGDAGNRCSKPARCSTRTRSTTIERLGIDEVKVRTPLTCDTRYGLCAKCYGRDLGRGVAGQRRRSGRRHRRAVDRRAGHAADDADVPHRRRGIACGGGDRRSKPSRTARCASPRPCATSPTRKGELVVDLALRRSDDHRRQRPRARAPQGAVRRDAAGRRTASTVKAGTLLASWDPLTRPIITEYAGTVKFENVEEGVTVAKQIDEVTGLSTLVVIDAEAPRREQRQGRASAGQAARTRAARKSRSPAPTTR